MVSIFLRCTRALSLVLLLGMGVFGSGSAIAQSEGAVLFVSPARLVVPAAEKVSVLSVINKSTLPRRYDLEMVDQAMRADGSTNRVDTFQYSAKRMLKFLPKRFTLQPGERQTVRVIVTRPADLGDGDYHSHLLFREVPLDVKTKAQLTEEQKAASQGKSLSFEIRTLFGIAVPMVIQNGALVADMTMGDVKIGMTPDGKQRQLTVDYNRTGNSEIALLMSADYVQDGKAVQVVPPQWVRIYREVDKISKDYTFDLPDFAKGGKIVVSLAKSETDEAPVRKEVTVN